MSTGSTKKHNTSSNFNFDPKELTKPPGDLILVRPMEACSVVEEQKRQLEAGLVQHFGDLLIDDTLMRPSGIYAVPMTPGLQRAIERAIVVEIGKLPSGSVIKNGIVCKETGGQ